MCKVFEHASILILLAVEMAGAQPACSSECDFYQESDKDTGPPTALCCHISLATCNSGAPGHGSRYEKFELLQKLTSCPHDIHPIDLTVVQLARSLANTTAYC